MPEALVFLKHQRIVFPVPINERIEPTPYSPKSFAGNRHIIRARLAMPYEIAVRRNLAFNPYDHTFYGRGAMTDRKDTGLTYVQCGILVAILLNSGAADYVITGCGTEEGAMLAINSFPGVIYGHVEDPVDAQYPCPRQRWQRCSYTFR